MKNRDDKGVQACGQAPEKDAAPYQKCEDEDQELWTDAPYPGLEAFGPDQAPIFFGRDSEYDWHENYDGAPNDGRAWVDDLRGAFRVIRGGRNFHRSKSALVKREDIDLLFMRLPN